MSSRSGTDTLAVLLILLGLGLIASGAIFYFTPMEEPASPGKTPNPYRINREIDREILVMRLRLFGAPAAGLLLAAIGIWVLAAGHRRGS